MKKMLSTTLVAIAFAMVSTVDAKVMKRAGAVKTTTAAQTVRENTQEVLANPTEASVAQTIDMVANDKAGVAIAEKKAKELQVNAQRELVASLGKKGWIFDGRTAEEIQRHKEASERLTQLEQELKDIKGDNEAVKKEVGISYFNAMFGTIIAVVAIGSVSVLDDILAKGRGKAMLAPYYEAGKAKAVAASQAMREKAGSMYTAGKGYATDAYNKLPSLRGQATAGK